MLVERSLRCCGIVLVLGMLGAQAAAQNSPLQRRGSVPVDAVVDGLVAVRPPMLRGLPIFDRRFQNNGPEEFEAVRWLSLYSVKTNPQILQNSQTAVTYAWMFLPTASLDQYFDCTGGGTRPSCAKAFSGTTAFVRSNSNELRYWTGAKFKGNEFESARLLKDFVDSYGPRLSAAAAPLPQDAYIAVNNALQPYSVADGGYRFLSSSPFGMNGVQREVALQRGFCAPANVDFPKMLRLDPTSAEDLANRIDNAAPRRSSNGDGTRPISMLLKVRINQISGIASGCASNMDSIELEVHRRDSLTNPLVVDLPLEKLSAETAAKPAAAPLRAAPSVTVPVPSVAGSPPVMKEPLPVGQAQVGALSGASRLDPSSSTGPEIVGIRLDMPLSQAEKIARDHLKPELVYELGIEGRSTGYPKGLALVSLKLGEAVFLYTGDATPGKVSGVERTVIADNVDMREAQEKYRARYMKPGGTPGLGRSTGIDCGVDFTSRTNKPAMKLISGKVPEEGDQARALGRLMGAARRLHANLQTGGIDRSTCGPGIYLNTEAGSNPMLIFSLWDHSKASFDPVPPEPPKRALKL